MGLCYKTFYGRNSIRIVLARVFVIVFYLGYYLGARQGVNPLNGVPGSGSTQVGSSLACK
jgi:hypothetical protein